MKDNLDLEISAELLDRLVDGELLDLEYRQVMVVLESRPDGWRRCAMAFLEEQALRRELGIIRAKDSLVDRLGDAFGVPAGVDVKAPKATEKPLRKTAQRWSLAAGLLTLASAASFLLAFTVVSKFYRPVSRESSNQLVTSPPSWAGGPEIPAAVSDRWGDYKLVVHGNNGETQQIEMPIFSQDDPRADMWLNERATTPVELIRGIERLGYQVESQRQWAPVGQADGRDIVVPIDELKITPVSSRSYQ